MSDPTTHRCPFCKATVYHHRMRLVHSEPECAEYRKWIDAAPPLHSTERDQKIIKASQEAQSMLEHVGRMGLIEGLGLSDESPPVTEAPPVTAWQPLLEEVQRVGLLNATPEQLARWADQLDALDAPALARTLRRYLPEGSSEDPPS